MKYIYSRYCLLLITCLLCYCANVYAQQQKPSQRSFAAEVAKIKEKQAAHDKLVKQMKQQEKLQATTPRNNNATTAVPAGNSNNNVGVRSTPVTTNNQANAVKPSQQAINVPRRPGKG